MEVEFKRSGEVVALGANTTKPKLYLSTGEDTHYSTFKHFQSGIHLELCLGIADM